MCKRNSVNNQIVTKHVCTIQVTVDFLKKEKYIEKYKKLIYQINLIRIPQYSKLYLYSPRIKEFRQFHRTHV